MVGYARRIRKLQYQIGIPVTDFDILGAQDPNETRANSCRFVYSKDQDKYQMQNKQVKATREAVNPCRYVRPKERDLNCNYKIDRSSKSVSPRYLIRRSPGEAFFPKPRVESEDFCRFSSRKDSNSFHHKTDSWTTQKSSIHWYVNPVDRYNKFFSSQDNNDGTDHHTDPRATQNPETLWYVNPGNICNQSDEENACYHRSSKSETQKEDENIERRRRHKSCTYKHNTFE